MVLMPARTGQMRHRVTIEAQTTTDDGAGGTSAPEWNPISDTPKVWARVQPLQGHERIQAMQLDSEATHRVTIRHRTGIDSHVRIVHGGRHLYPVGPWLDEGERRARLTAICREDTD